MDARETVRSYYDALRDGAPLGPYFAPAREGDDEHLKYGVSETLVGTDEIRAGLAEQTATTTDWVVDSRALRVIERERYASTSDDVFLAWTDTERGIRFEFDTRWSATLERHRGGSEPADVDGPTWRFLGMHVSTATEL